MPYAPPSPLLSVGLCPQKKRYMGHQFGHSSQKKWYMKHYSGDTQSAGPVQTFLKELRELADKLPFPHKSNVKSTTLAWVGTGVFYVTTHTHTHTRTCSPPCDTQKMHILPIYPQQLLGNDCQNPKIQKSKTFYIYGILHVFWIFVFVLIFGFLDFWFLGFLDFGIFGIWDFLNFRVF